jgi:hypothetical protein
MQDEIGRLLAVVERQQQQIDQLIQLVERNERARSAPPPPPPPPPPPSADAPIDWMRISGRERLLAWQQLATFVEALVLRFDMHLDVTPCWWRHGEAVEELTGLWLSRKAAYRKGAGIHTAQPWLNSLEGSRERLRDRLATCREGHIDTSMRGRVWMDDATRAAFIEAVRQDVLASGPGET